MYFLNGCWKILVLVQIFFLSFTLAQDTAFQTIYSLDIYSSQKPCAQQCFIDTGLGCHVDAVARAIGCQYNACNANYGSPNNCYCRQDLQPVAESFLTSCVKNGCTVGDSSIDISSAGSIYSYYCSSLGFPVNVPATTTPGSAQATTTVASSSNQPTSTTSPSYPTSNTQSTPSGSPASSSPDNSQGPTGLSVGDKAAIAGSVVGGVAILTGILVGIFSHEMRACLSVCFCCFDRRTPTYATGPVQLSHIGGALR